MCGAALKADSDDNVTAVVWSEDWNAFCAGVPAVIRSGAIPAAGGLPWYRRRAVLAAVAAVLVAAAVAVGVWKLVLPAVAGDALTVDGVTVETWPDGSPAGGTAGTNATTTTSVLEQTIPGGAVTTTLAPEEPPTPPEEPPTPPEEPPTPPEEPPTPPEEPPTP